MTDPIPVSDVWVSNKILDGAVELVRRMAARRIDPGVIKPRQLYQMICLNLCLEEIDRRELGGIGYDLVDKEGKPTALLISQRPNLALERALEFREER